MSAGPTAAVVIAAIERELHLAASGEGYEPATVAGDLYRMAAQSIAAMLEAGPPSADWIGMWAELDGYLQEACADGGPIDPNDMRAYLDELKRKALAPIRAWMDTCSTPKKEGTG